MPAPTIGILAGMGPRSTGPFLDLVIDACQEIYGARHDIDFPKMVICSQPVPFYEDRPVDHPALERATIIGLHTLEAAGADFLAIACNTVHIYYPRLAAAVRMPLLNIVEFAIRAVPVSARAIALVAARPTTQSRLFQDALSVAGYTALEVSWQDETDALLTAVRGPTNPEQLRTLWAAVLDKAMVAGSDTILLACLDLSAVLRHAESPLPVVDAAACLARAIVEHWLSHGGAASQNR